MPRNTFKQCGQVVAIYRDDEFQCYWNPNTPDALWRLHVIVNTLIAVA